VKLRGRTEAPDGAEGAQFLSARGDTTDFHGPLQRLLCARPQRFYLITTVSFCTDHVLALGINQYHSGGLCDGKQRRKRWSGALNQYSRERVI
jgi:hypothetical protein